MRRGLSAGPFHQILGRVKTAGLLTAGGLVNLRSHPLGRTAFPWHFVERVSCLRDSGELESLSSF